MGSPKSTPWWGEPLLGSAARAQWSIAGRRVSAIESSAAVLASRYDLCRIDPGVKADLVRIKNGASLVSSPFLKRITISEVATAAALARPTARRMTTR